MQIEWSEGGWRSSRESSRPVEEEPAHLRKDESMAEVSLGGDREKMSGGNRGTLRRDALKRVDSAVCRLSDFMQPRPGAVENGVGVVRL
jgi:hypothetical protein